MSESIKRIVVPTDFSETADGALEYALELARPRGAEVLLLHVEPLLRYAIHQETATDLPELRTKIAAYAEQELGKRAEQARAAGVPVEVEAVEGNPGLRIPEIAKERGADLIVMGTHGRSGVQRVVLGSVAERVVRLSSVPVLTTH